MKNDWRVTEEWLKNDWRMTEAWLIFHVRITIFSPKNNHPFVYWPRLYLRMTRLHDVNHALTETRSNDLCTKMGKLWKKESRGWCPECQTCFMKSCFPGRCPHCVSCCLQVQKKSRARLQCEVHCNGQLPIRVSSMVGCTSKYGGDVSWALSTLVTDFPPPSMRFLLILW